MNSFVVVDFETTGLVLPRAHWDRQPGITQIGALKFNPDDWEIVDALDFLINPELPESAWEESAIKVTGITPQMVVNEKSLFGRFNDITNFFVGSEVWLGYNTDFDQDALYHQLHRYGLEKNFPWPPNTVDVMKICRDRLNTVGKRGTKNVKLGEAYEEIVGKPMSNAHNALADVTATYEIYKALNQS